MQIILQRDWDSLPSGLATPSQYFSGREKELSQLKHIILNKTAGSILIGAPRGVGKTDLVYKAIAGVTSANNKVTFIPVILNATQLHEITDSNELGKAIVTNLITRLYATTKDKVSADIFKKIAKLYYQATAKRYEEKTTLSDSKENDIENVETHIKLSIWKISLSRKNLEDIIKIGTPISALSLAFVTNLLKGISEWGILLIYTILLILLLISQSVDFSTQGEEINKKTKKKSQSENILEKAEILYLLDNSSGNLESGLKDIFQQIQATKKYKLFFVIDEMDKIEFKQNASEILTMIQTFKDLFNHADALFIFICDRQIFDAALLARKNRKTNVYSTLFNERIYITRPTVSDLKEYLRKIVFKHQGNKNDLDNFMDFIIFKSHMDFFMVADNIRDYEDIYKDGKPVLSWVETTDNFQIINKQKIITALLEDGNYLYKELSNRSYNEDLIETLYDITEKKLPFELAKFPTETDPHLKTIKQLELDVSNHLYRSGIFQRSALSRNSIEYFLYMPTAATGRSITKLNDPLEFENEYLSRFEQLEKFILRIYNLRAEIINKKKAKEVNLQVLQEVERISGFSQELHKAKKIIYKNLKQDPARHDLSQEEIKSHIAEIDTHCGDVVRNNTLLILKNILEEKKIAIWNIQQSPEILDRSPSLKSYIIANSISNILATPVKGKSLHNIIFLLNPIDTIANNQSVFNELRKDKKVYVVELYSGENKPNISRDKGNRFESVSIQNFDLNAFQIKSWLNKYF